MPGVKQPCLQCKEKHVKCDEERPRCRRCQEKQLPCSRPARKTVFKHGSPASFAKDQKWVSGSVRHFRFHPRGGAVRQLPGEPTASSAPPDPPPRPTPTPPPAPAPAPAARPAAAARRSESPPAAHSDARLVPDSAGELPPLPPPPPPPPPDDARRRFPLEDVQEACLLRYFVDELSHWFDLCDQDRHFQLVVPLHARRHPHLLDAILAVAARHLSRLPHLKTPGGVVVYHGQPLPGLGERAAVEYMLRCIPALRQFDGAAAADDDYRDSIMATAVILRQLEEIDHDDHDPRRVNFLAVIDAVLRSLPSCAVFAQRPLLQAAYWMALRQEIFNAFTRREAPQLMLPPEFWHTASRANKVVMHLVQTAKWHWGPGSNQEWTRLMDQQRHVDADVLAPFRPIYRRPADKSKGEIFPIIWYGSNIEVTSVQLALIAKAVLVAENPFLRADTSRASWRRVESEVRLLLLDLCGITLCNPASPPALVQAALGIGLYSDFFTDHYERQAIRTVVERYRDAHAWPVQQLLAMFQ